MSSGEATICRSETLVPNGTSNTIEGAFQRQKRSRTDSEQNYISHVNNDTPVLRINDEPLESISNETVVSNPGFYLKEKEHLTFKLDRLNDKKCRYESHEAFLNKCLNSNLVPNGLKVYVEPSIGNRDELFLTQWHARLEEFSKTLTMDVVAYCEKELTNTKTEIEATSKKLKDLITASEFTDINNTITANQTSRVNELTQRKNRKFYNLKYRNNNYNRSNYHNERIHDRNRIDRKQFQPKSGFDSDDRWEDNNRRNNRTDDRHSNSRNRSNSRNGRYQYNERTDNNFHDNDNRDSARRPGVSYANALKDTRKDGNYSRRSSYRKLDTQSPTGCEVPLSERISLHRRNSRRNLPHSEKHGTRGERDNEIEELRRRLKQLESGEKEKVIHHQILQSEIPAKNVNEVQRSEMGQSKITEISEMKSFLVGVMDTIKEFDKLLTNQLNTDPTRSERS